MTTSSPPRSAPSVPASNILLDLSRSVSMIGKLQRQAHEQPEGDGIVFDRAVISWRQYFDLVLHLAQEMSDRGIGKGDRVAAVLTNRPEFLIATLAANAVGAIIVPINFRLAAGEIAYVIDNVDPALLLVESFTQDVATSALLETKSAPALLDCDSRDLLALDAYENGPLPLDEIIVADAKDDFVILHTSGTTGNPKGAVLSNLTVYSAAIQNAARWGTNPGEGVVMLAPPLFHVGSFLSAQNALAAGAAALVVPSSGFDAARTLETMKRDAVTAAFMIPQQWSMLCDIIEQDGNAGLAITHASWGGAPATEKLLTRMAQCMPEALINRRHSCITALRRFAAENRLSRQAHL